MHDNADSVNGLLAKPYRPFRTIRHLMYDSKGNVIQDVVVGPYPYEKENA